MADDRALTVGEAVGRAKSALETVSARVVGEVTDFKTYKAVYFTLGDGTASMDCIIWPDAYRACGVELACGMQVEVTGNFSVYAPKGRMQFSVRTLQAAGEGVLRMQVAALGRRLEAEGLMRADRKRSLPRFPSRIALVTSPRGKAVWDVVRTLRRRYPMAELLIAGVRVEGADAPAQIVEGLRAAADARPDVIILARGGGSYEDLMPFNAEEVARAVVASPVPVVTGIGHEPDTSIADMVADVRASTPTAAAEAVAPSAEEIAAVLGKEQRLLGRALQHQVQSASHRVELMAGRRVFREPESLLETVRQRVDLAGAALSRALPERVRADTERVALLRGHLEREGPRAVERAETAVVRLGDRLADLSPLGILGRGYAVCFREDGRTVVREAATVDTGERVDVRLGVGVLGCRVESVNGGGTHD